MKRKFKIGDNVIVISNPDVGHKLHDRGIVTNYYSGFDIPYGVSIKGLEGS